jgi:hypothetical protein
MSDDDATYRGRGALYAWVCPECLALVPTENLHLDGWPPRCDGSVGRRDVWWHERVEMVPVYRVSLRDER